MNAKAFEDNTPLHDAAIVGNIKLVKLLIEKGADPMAKNRKGKTPCDVASAAVYSYLQQAKGKWWSLIEILSVCWAIFCKEIAIICGSAAPSCQPASHDTKFAIDIYGNAAHLLRIKK